MALRSRAPGRNLRRFHGRRTTQENSFPFLPAALVNKIGSAYLHDHLKRFVYCAAINYFRQLRRAVNPCVGNTGEVEDSGEPGAVICANASDCPPTLNCQRPNSPEPPPQFRPTPLSSAKSPSLIVTPLQRDVPQLPSVPTKEPVLDVERLLHTALSRHNQAVLTKLDRHLIPLTSDIKLLHNVVQEARTAIQSQAPVLARHEVCLRQHEEDIARLAMSSGQQDCDIATLQKVVSELSEKTAQIEQNRPVKLPPQDAEVTISQERCDRLHAHIAKDNDKNAQDSFAHVLKLFGVPSDEEEAAVVTTLLAKLEVPDVPVSVRRGRQGRRGPPPIIIHFNVDATAIANKFWQLKRLSPGHIPVDHRLCPAKTADWLLAQRRMYATIDQVRHKYPELRPAVRGGCWARIGADYFANTDFLFPAVNLSVGRAVLVSLEGKVRLLESQVENCPFSSQEAHRSFFAVKK